MYSNTIRPREQNLVPVTQSCPTRPGHKEWELWEEGVSDLHNSITPTVVRVNKSRVPLEPGSVTTELLHPSWETTGGPDLIRRIEDNGTDHFPSYSGREYCMSKTGRVRVRRKVTRDRHTDTYIPLPHHDPPIFLLYHPDYSLDWYPPWIPEPCVSLGPDPQFYGPKDRVERVGGRRTN